MPHINQSWREQRKAVIGLFPGTDYWKEYTSIWQASHEIAERKGCKPETAKKEIRKAIKTGKVRYRMKWFWKEF